MTLDEAVAAVYQRWLDEWVDDNDDEVTVTVFDDEPDTDVNGGDVPWVRLSVRHTGEEQATQGAVSTVERFASVFAQVHTLAGRGRQNEEDGDLAADKLTQRARAVFEKTRIDGTSLVFFVGGPREGATDGRWRVTPVEIPFRYHETT